MLCHRMFLNASQLEYIPDDFLGALLGKTELIAGVAAGLVVFIIVLVIACKCNLFNRVNITSYASLGNYYFTQSHIGENLQAG